MEYRIRTQGTILDKHRISKFAVLYGKNTQETHVVVNFRIKFMFLVSQITCPTDEYKFMNLLHHRGDLEEIKLLVGFVEYVTSIKKKVHFEFVAKYDEASILHCTKFSKIWYIIWSDEFSTYTGRLTNRNTNSNTTCLTWTVFTWICKPFWASQTRNRL